MSNLLFTEEKFSLSNPGGGLNDLFGRAPSSPAPTTQAPAPSSPAPAQQRPAEGPTILFAVPSIPVFKYNTASKQYESVGKVGLAILGIVSLNTFQLIIYQTKEVFLCTVTISPQFVFNVIVESNTHYGSFSEGGQTWSITFPSLEVLSRFATQLAISKALSSRSEEIVTQDVVPGSGKAIGNGDAVRIKYVGFLIQGSKAGQIFDSNVDSDKPFRLTIGSGKGILGLDSGVIGMTKKARRIIVVPAKLGYGSKGADGIPPNSNLVFQVDLVAVKAASVEKSAPEIEIEDVPAKESTTLERVRKLGVSVISDPVSPLKSSSQPDQQPAHAVDSAQQQNQQQFNNYQPLQAQQSQFQGQPNQFQQYPGQFQGQQGQFQSNQFQQGQSAQFPGQFQGQQGQFQPNQFQQSQQSAQFGQSQFPDQQGQFPGAQNQYQQGQLGQFQGQQSQFQPNQFQQGQQGYFYPPGQGDQQQLAVFNPQQNQLNTYQGGNNFQQQGSQPPISSPQPAAPQPTQLPTNEGNLSSTGGGPINHSQLDNIPFSNAENNKFLHETRMIHEEIKSSIFAATAKIETGHRNIKNAIFGREDEVSKERISGSVLIQTITKYVEDNEQLQNEIVNKSARIDELREKITNLLEKNKQLIEEHTNTMEDRNTALSEASDQAKKLLIQLRDEKLKLDEEFHTISETLSQTRGNLTKLNISNLDLTQRSEEMSNEINNLQSELNLQKSNKINEDSKYNELNLQLRDEQTERKRVQMELQSLEEELHEAKENLQKLKNLIEERKNKWIQAKAEIDKQHEDEKAAVMQKMKAQYLKFKKEKDDAVAEAANIERETEARWRKNILALRERFKEKVDDLKKDSEEEKQQKITLLNEQLKQEQKKLFEEEKEKINTSYKEGFKEGRNQKLNSLQQQKSIEIQEKTELFFGHTKKFMENAMKNLMSNVYLSIKEEIGDADVLNGSHVLSFLVDSVKISTFEALKNIEQHFANESNKVSEDIIKNRFSSVTTVENNGNQPKLQHDNIESASSSSEEEDDVEVDDEPSEIEEESPQLEDDEQKEEVEEEVAEDPVSFDDQQQFEELEQESRELELEQEPEHEEAEEVEEKVEEEIDEQPEPEPEEPEEEEVVEEEPESEPEVPEEEVVEEKEPEPEEPGAAEVIVSEEDQPEPEEEVVEEKEASAGEEEVNDDEFDKELLNNSNSGFSTLLESVIEEDVAEDEIKNELDELNELKESQLEKEEKVEENEESSSFSSSEKEEEKEKEEEIKEEENKINNEDPLGIAALSGKSTDKATADIFGGGIFSAAKQPAKPATTDIFALSKSKTNTPTTDPLSSKAAIVDVDDLFGESPAPKTTSSKAVVDPLSSKSSDVDNLFGDVPAAKPKQTETKATVKLSSNVDDLFAEPAGGSNKGGDIFGASSAKKVDIFSVDSTKAKPKDTKVDEDFDSIFGGGPSKTPSKATGKPVDIFASATTPTKKPAVNFDDLFS